MFSLKASISSTETDLIIIISKRNSWVKHHVHQLIYQQLFIENINYFSDDSTTMVLLAVKSIVLLKFQSFPLSSHPKIYMRNKHIKNLWGILVFALQMHPVRTIYFLWFWLIMSFMYQKLCYIVLSNECNERKIMNILRNVFCYKY